MYPKKLPSYQLFDKFKEKYLTLTVNGARMWALKSGNQLLRFYIEGKKLKLANFHFQEQHRG